MASELKHTISVGCIGASIIKLTKKTYKYFFILNIYLFLQPENNIIINGIKIWLTINHQLRESDKLKPERYIIVILLNQCEMQLENLDY